MSQSPVKRLYRQEVSRPIPVWNGILEHRKRIGPAIWVFLWLLDAVTKDENGTGLVLGGVPIKAARIALDLDFDEWTILQHLQKLEAEHYVSRRRTPVGFVIGVLNSRKFGIWRAHKRSGENPNSFIDRIGVSQGQIVGFPIVRSGENPRNKEDAAVMQQKDAAASKPAAQLSLRESVWTFLGIEPCGPMSFRSLLESRWLSKNGQLASMAIGEAIDEWELENETKPPRAARFFKALSELRLREKQQAQPPKSAEQPIHQLTAEEIPA